MAPIRPLGDHWHHSLYVSGPQPPRGTVLEVARRAVIDCHGACLAAQAYAETNTVPALQAHAERYYWERRRKLVEAKRDLAAIEMLFARNPASQQQAAE